MNHHLLIITILTVTLSSACGHIPTAQQEKMTWQDVGLRNETAHTEIIPLSVGTQFTPVTPQKSYIHPQQEVFTIGREDNNEADDWYMEPARLADEVNQWRDTRVTYEHVDNLASAHSANTTISIKGLTTATRPMISMIWPVEAIGITSLFGPRRHPISGRNGFHFGVDLQSAYGSSIAAVSPGVIRFAGWNGGHGRTVIVEHSKGFRSRYSHLSQITVTEGSIVAMGQTIGLVGNSGFSTGPHLHMEISRFTQRLDPLDFLGRSIPLD